MPKHIRTQRGHRRGDRGVALVFVTFAIAALLVAVSGALVVGATNSKATWNYRAASQVHFVAESGLSHALQNINATGTNNFQTEIVNDWGNRFGTASKNFAPLAGFSYAVLATPPGAGDPSFRGRLISTATGPDGTTNTVVANVTRTNNLATAPGAVYLATDQTVSTNFDGNNFVIDGNDHRLPPAVGAGPAAPVPGISTRNQSNTTSVITDLSSGQLDNVLGLGFQAGPPMVPSVMTSTWAPTINQMDEFVNAILAMPGVVNVTDTQITGGTHIGGSTIDPPVPVIVHSTSTDKTTVGAGNVEGAGIWIVEGDLEIKGTLDYAGLIIVKGRTTVTKDDTGSLLTGNATIYGSLWSQDVQFSAGGSASVYYSSDALALAGATNPGLPLPTTVGVASLADCAAVPAGAGGCP